MQGKCPPHCAVNEVPRNRTWETQTHCGPGPMSSMCKEALKIKRNIPIREQELFLEPPLPITLEKDAKALAFRRGRKLGLEDMVDTHSDLGL